MRLKILIEAEDGDEPKAFKYIEGMFEDGCSGCSTATKNGKMNIEIDYGPFDDDEWKKLR